MREISHKLAFADAPAATRFSDVFDPNNGGVQARVALGDAALLDRAVAAAKAAQPAWAAVNPQRRARVMFNFKALVEKNMDDLAHLLSHDDTSECLHHVFYYRTAPNRNFPLT